MAEAFVVMSNIVTVMQLIKVSAECVYRVWEFQVHKEDYPQAFRSLQIALPFVETTLEKLKAKAETGQMSPKEAKQIEALLNSCGERIKELNSIFDKYLPKESSGRWERFTKAIGSLIQNERVEDIAREIMQSVQLFTLHTTAALPTAEEISAIVTADLEKSMDSGIGTIVRYLKEHSSTAVTNNTLNRQTVYNGQTQIYNHYYFNVTDSRMIEHVGTIQTRVGSAESQRRIEGSRLMKMISSQSDNLPSPDIQQAMEVFAPSKDNELSQNNLFVSGPSTLESNLTPSNRGQRISIFQEKEVVPEDLPEVVGSDYNYRAQPYSHGFVVPMESTLSLATTVSSGSSNVRSPSQREALQEPPFRRAFTPQPPTRDGYFELDSGFQRPTSSARPSFSGQNHLNINVEPRINHRKSFESSWSDSTRDMASSAVSGSTGHSSEGAFSNISGLSSYTTSSDPSNPLAHPAFVLRHASSLVGSDPSSAKSAYMEAISLYNLIYSRDPTINLRRLRSLVSAELGLSMVVTDALKHIDRAHRYAEEAQRAAQTEAEQQRVSLDRGNIKAREAKVREKKGEPMADDATVEAWRIFDEVASSLQNKSRPSRSLGRTFGIKNNTTATALNAEDCNTAAQALLGCARCARKLSGRDVGGGRRIRDRRQYIMEAKSWIDKALNSSNLDKEGRERLLETQKLVNDMMR